MTYTTRRNQIVKAMNLHGESFDDVERLTIRSRRSISDSATTIDREFDSSYGAVEGDPFTLWTRNRVYFPAMYDGSEWVESVPRNPCDEVTQPVGG